MGVLVMEEDEAIMEGHICYMIEFSYGCLSRDICRFLILCISFILYLCT